MLMKIPLPRSATSETSCIGTASAASSQDMLWCSATGLDSPYRNTSRDSCYSDTHSNDLEVRCVQKGRQKVNRVRVICNLNKSKHDYKGMIV
jgi:hypothetical protein